MLVYQRVMSKTIENCFTLKMWSFSADPQKPEDFGTRGGHEPSQHHFFSQLLSRGQTFGLVKHGYSQTNQLQIIVVYHSINISPPHFSGIHVWKNLQPSPSIAKTTRKNPDWCGYKSNGSGVYPWSWFSVNDSEGKIGTMMFLSTVAIWRPLCLLGASLSSLVGV